MSVIPDVICPHCGGVVTVEKTNFFESHLCEHCLNFASIKELSSCCNRPDYKPVKFVTASQTIQVREQCQYCGNIKGNSIGGFNKDERERLPVADVDKRERRSTFISGAYKKLSEKKLELSRTKNKERYHQRLKEYSDYLNSPEWKAKRLLVLQRDKYLCQSCLLTKAIQVHHKTYEFCDLKGNEPCFDLFSVCLPCHDYIENRKREIRLSNSKL